MAAIPYRCMVQQGQISSQVEAILRRRLDEFSKHTFGAPAVFNWLVVPAKSGFTAGQPSSCSFVLALSNQVLDKEHRTQLLRAVCDIWMQETGCSLDEVVAAIGDPRDG